MHIHIHIHIHIHKCHYLLRDAISLFTHSLSFYTPFPLLPHFLIYPISYIYPYQVLPAPLPLLPTLFPYLPHFFTYPISLSTPFPCDHPYPHCFYLFTGPTGATTSSADAISLSIPLLLFNPLSFYLFFFLSVYRSHRCHHLIC